MQRDGGFPGRPSFERRIVLFDHAARITAF